MNLAAGSRRAIAFLITLVTAVSAASVTSAADPTSPEAFFGFPIGADRKLARWDEIVEYFQLIEGESDRIRVVDLGPSTEGHPFLLVIITSADNLANLERLREVNLRIQDPSTPESEVRNLIEEGKAVISQSLGLHSTEVAGAQTAPELAYDFLSRDDAETRRILDETILLMFPCFNPDGQIMVTDWYRKYLDTEYEGVRLPWLYHKYAGHDNNRDGDYLNLDESEYIAKVLYRDWKPQAYIDHHQMGSYGARFFVPPYGEPIRPYADPLMWREIDWYGGHIAYKLEEHGKQGVLNGAQYPGWGHFGWHWITPFHNIAGMLTESASASLATPLYVHPEQLQGGARQFPEYQAQATMPNPWPGGWWRVRDIVEQQKIAAWALQDLAARNKDTVLWNAHLKAKRQTERGAAGSPKAYVVPTSQHDPLTAVEMVNTLLKSDIEILHAREAFDVEGMRYAEGSFVVPLAQPKVGLVRNLLGRTFYPDNEWTRDRDGTPLRPYDTATHTMFEFMGVRVDPIDASVADLEADIEALDGAVMAEGDVATDAEHLVLDGRLNASFEAVNRLVDEGITVLRVDRATSGLRPGDFVISGAAPSGLSELARELGVDFTALESAPGDEAHVVERKRVGMYQRYHGGNMDEGWSRLVLEDFGFPFTSVMDEEILAGGLEANYDVFILPHDSATTILGEEEGQRPGRRPEDYPPEYRSGIGDEGVESLESFVRAGGTLVTFGEAAELAIDELDLNLVNVVDGLGPREFFCPGSTLRVTIDTDHPLGYGMPSEALVLFWESPVFSITPSRNNDDYEVIARYVDENVLASGWLIGEDHLANKAAMISARLGEGQVVLIGFRPQHRAQTHGTFKVLFNTMLQ